VQFTDEYADTQIEIDGTQGGLRAFAALKRSTDCTHLKVLISIGGGGEGSAHFAAIAHDGALRMRFANSARALVDEYGLDGIDSESASRASLAPDRTSRLGAPVGPAPGR
jgi:chitinase